MKPSIYNNTWLNRGWALATSLLALAFLSSTKPNTNIQTLPSSHTNRRQEWRANWQTKYSDAELTQKFHKRDYFQRNYTKLADAWLNIICLQDSFKGTKLVCNSLQTLASHSRLPPPHSKLTRSVWRLKLVVKSIMLDLQTSFWPLQIVEQQFYSPCRQ